MPSTKRIRITAKDESSRSQPQAAQPSWVDQPLELEGAEGGPETSSIVAGSSKEQNSSRTDDASSSASNTNPTNKRARSPPSSLPDNSPPSNTETGLYNNVMTKQQSIEMITQKEALHHVEMAWRAQQRLVRRCLGLRLFGETQSADVKDDCNDAGKESDAAKSYEK
mmetsp:Transcript_4044/g.7210  ORF Transcript_4044/g.7210 Transcript_4044/m.7210 type:complete len:167 (-) Transcript_4044:191-691(-)